MVDVITTRQMLCLFLMTDVFPICLYMWQMLLSYVFYVADVIAIDVSYCGRCYCHHSLLADVIAILCVDMIVWQVLLPLWVVVLPFDNLT